ncbi:hypothetical protein [Janthinobacterium agaricidamnosum]|uniref:Uncharacterized protein n=1 Tax=Janthinobacterium agaricidamnosum NBRC 102515 = DSM 9628 TaxID=1349767 RepID=W0V6M3_9BURK|nr:hypothetical protein [Janthinobacterium agaricidamnosum]CDG83521.1 hypothetical protein GJA_2892 [Janthinobacterium agaricidamnosum NBRC 102515 = DSM 9628]
MSKTSIAKAILQELTREMENVGYCFDKETSSVELNIFTKENALQKTVLSYSLNGRGNYKAFGQIKIIYKDLSEIMKDIFKNSKLSEDYDYQKSTAYWEGVGIYSTIGRFSNDKTIYHCNSKETSIDFAKNYARQIKSEEENFINPHLNQKTTIEEFMKPMHHFWPGDLRAFLEHLVGYAIKTSDTNLLKYAFQKAEDVSEKLVPQARSTDFTAELKNATRNIML